MSGSANVEERSRMEKILPSRKTLVRPRTAAQFPWAVAIVAALALLVPFAASAQNNTVPARVTDRINAAQTVTLQGSTHPLAQAKFDQGAAPPNLPMNRIMLLLKRSPAQESALQDLLVQQQVQSSPSFHKWLTPDQFGQQFGPADSDIQAVTSWLASFGFQSIKVSRGRTVIEFSGTASQVQTALHAPIHQYTVNGVAHWANASDPQIPAPLAPVIAGFASLHNFPKKPASVRSARTAAFTRTPNGKPQITFSSDGSHAMAPADFNTIYNVAPSMTGTNVTIGVIARSNINIQDVSNFRSTFSLGGSVPNIILNGPDPGDLGGGEEAEAVLDATWPGAIAPAATVDLVVSETTNAAQGEDLSEFYIIDNNLADVMTESFSVCESGFGSSLTTNANFYSGMAEQAAAQGISYIVASGDGGPDSCDDPSTLPAAPTAASVNLLAATLFTTAVGGTEFHDCDPMPRCTDTSTTYWQAANTSSPLGASAKSYIPENAWNESCTVAQCGSSLSGLWSSGGGASLAFPVPVWQAGVTGISTTNTARLVPDVSLAAADHDGYLLCLDASCQGSSPSFSVLSGTSASAQAFGGVMALVVQKMVGRVGLANYALYKLAAGQPPTSPANSPTCNGSSVLPALPPAGTCIFNDVTSGNTNLAVGTPPEGFPAGAGYDEATGLGSVNVSNLVNNWHTAITKSTTTTLSLNPTSFKHGASVSVSVSVGPVAPATGAPTGDVSLIAQNIPGAANPNAGVDCNILPNTPAGQGSGCLNALNGNATFTGNDTVSWLTNFLPGGTYQLHAHYAGDGTFLGSDSTPAMTVTVTPEVSRISLGLVVTTASSCSTATSVVYGSPYVLTVVVADVNAGSLPCSPNETGSSPTGTVSVTDAFNGGPANQLDGGSFKLNTTGAFEDQTIQLVPGTHNIQASYPGDNSFGKSTTTAPTVTVSKAPTTATITSSPATVAANTPFSLTAFIDTQTTTNGSGSSGAAPSGTVTFTEITGGSVYGPSRRDWPRPNQFLMYEVCAALSGLFMLLLARNRRLGPAWLGMALAIVIAVGTSCGGTSVTGNNSGTPLGTVNVTSSPDANGFAGATATLNNVKLTANTTITVTYSGDSNYGTSASRSVTVTVP